MLLAINDENMIGKTSKQAEAILKTLPRRLFSLTAMAPPKDVTGSGLSSEALPSPSPPAPAPPAVPFVPHRLPQVTVKKEEKPDHNNVDSADEEVDALCKEGIVQAVLQRCNGDYLGFELEGTINSKVHLPHIKSLIHNSPASKSGLFCRGDELVMVGDVCLVGKSLSEAKHVLENAPFSVLVVAQRKVLPELTSRSQVGLSSVTPELTSRSQVGLSSVASANTKNSLPLSVQGQNKASSTDKPTQSDSQEHVQPSDLILISTSTTDNCQQHVVAPISIGATNIEELPTHGSSIGKCVQPVSRSQHLYTKAIDVDDCTVFPGSKAFTQQVVPEENLTIRLVRASGEKFGLKFIGGIDNPNLDQVHVSIKYM